MAAAVATEQQLGDAMDAVGAQLQLAAVEAQSDAKVASMETEAMAAIASDNVNPMFGSWTCVKAQLNGESVTQYAGHEMMVPHKGVAFPTMMHVRPGSGDP